MWISGLVAAKHINHPIGYLVNCLNVNDVWKRLHFCYLFSLISMTERFCVIISIIEWNFLIIKNVFLIPFDKTFHANVHFPRRFDVLLSLHNLVLMLEFQMGHFVTTATDS